MAFPLTEEEHNFIEASIQAIPEIIVAAAVRYENGAIVFKERPGRHADAMNAMGYVTDHGFVTSRGRYVGRQEAARIAEATGQGSARKYPGYEPALHSEDMWHDTSKEGPFISQEDKDEYVESLRRDTAMRTNALRAREGSGRTAIHAETV